MFICFTNYHVSFFISKPSILGLLSIHSKAAQLCLFVEYQILLVTSIVVYSLARWPRRCASFPDFYFNNSSQGKLYVQYPFSVGPVSLWEL